MNQVKNDQIRQNVRSRYKEIALQEVEPGSCCVIVRSSGVKLHRAS